MGARTHRPECWGPLTPTDLLRRLAAADQRVTAEASRSGHHPTPAYFIAWEGLSEHYRKGRPLNPARLPWHAQRVVEDIQTQRSDW